jgi:hypothetical protein
MMIIMSGAHCAGVRAGVLEEAVLGAQVHGGVRQLSVHGEEKWVGGEYYDVNGFYALGKLGNICCQCCSSVYWNRIN